MGVYNQSAIKSLFNGKSKATDAEKEDLMPFHNALTPADEMIPEGITVALGTDNICDYMVPLCEGDLWQELSLLAAGCRFPHLDAMVDIASINGRKVLGLEPI